MNSNNNLWPVFDDIPNVVTPAHILKEQINFLEAGTKRIITGELMPTRGSSDKIAYVIRINAPFVGNYSFSFLKIEHSIALYPVTVYNIVEGVTYNCANESEFKAELKHIFSSERVKGILTSLLSQSRSSTIIFDEPME
ncbi:hypothetical protein [Chitinophaga pinensis]|uniref:Uncharacterized protein n=1 Tax=Chitinophaga pinensis (strain ATCC 43595 / DSM 2588 / LMG 13176 / NBRC 15968 / NCIMB 11800 / UQM 2034) TaxID=485918 RepID=A0A979GVB5_CHIPD|nr:hypothetical protein [Chitinophaga pinensis]ACU63318.1 hypothetical protein Cpin_5900 [Chitinophaga pinensis DSM 2588]